jgi:hypothetical protein
MARGLWAALVALAVRVRGDDRAVLRHERWLSGRWSVGTAASAAAPSSTAGWAPEPVDVVARATSVQTARGCWSSGEHSRSVTPSGASARHAGSRCPQIGW